jgi:hypothetical protein
MRSLTSRIKLPLPTSIINVRLYFRALQNRCHRDFVEIGIKSLGLVYIISVDKLKERKHNGEGKIMLKCILQKQDDRLWT